MSERWIFVDWDLPQLKLVLAEQAGAQWIVLQAQQLTLPDGLVGNNQGRYIAEWLQQQSPAWQFEVSETHPVRMAIVLPRDRVTLRQLELPYFPVEELPTIVPLQMANLLSTRPEDLVVDFLPPRHSADQSQLQVSATAIPSPQLNDLRVFAMALHTQLVLVDVSSCGLHGLAEQLPGILPEGAASVVVSGSLHRLESILVQGNQLISSGFRRRNGNTLTAKEIAAEVRRLQTAANDRGDQPPGQLLLITQEQAAPRESVQLLSLLSEVSQTLNLPALRADLESLDLKFTSAHPTERLDLAHLQTGGFLTLASLMLSVGDRKTPHINLHDPRQPLPVRDRRKQTIIGGALAAMLVIGVALWMWNANLQTLKNEIDSLQTRKLAADKLIRERGGVLKQVSNMDQYGQRSLGLSGHLSGVMQSMPARDLLVFTQWRSVPLTGTSHTRVIAAGLAKSRQDVEQFTEKLGKSGYIVRPPVIRNQEKVKGYTYEFDLDYEIPVQPEINPLDPQKIQPENTASIPASETPPAPTAR